MSRSLWIQKVILSLTYILNQLIVTITWTTDQHIPNIAGLAYLTASSCDLGEFAATLKHSYNAAGKCPNILLGLTIPLISSRLPSTGSTKPPREPLLALKPVVDDNQDSTKSFLITTFHPYFRECDNIVTRNWDLLDRSSSTRPLMNLQVIRGNRRSKNLRDLLVRARLPIMPAAAPQPTTPFQRTTTPPPGAPRRTITPRCTRRGCRYCRIINRTGTITSSVTGKQYNTRSNVTCHSNNIILLPTLPHLQQTICRTDKKEIG